MRLLGSGSSLFEVAFADASDFLSAWYVVCLFLCLAGLVALAFGDTITICVNAACCAVLTSGVAPVPAAAYAAVGATTIVTAYAL